MYYISVVKTKFSMHYIHKFIEIVSFAYAEALLITRNCWQKVGWGAGRPPGRAEGGGGGAGWEGGGGEEGGRGGGRRRTSEAPTTSRSTIKSHRK